MACHSNNMQMTPRCIFLSQNQTKMFASVTWNLASLTCVPGSPITVWHSTQINPKPSCLAPDNAALPQLTSSTVNISTTSITLQDQVKLLGVTMDSNLTFNNHVASVAKSCYYHIRAFRHIRPMLTSDMAKTVASSLIGARLDYANAVLYGTSASNINRLQLVQNTVARVVTGLKKSDHISQTLRDLHWLPVRYRINFKTTVLTYKAQTSAAPLYLSSLISSYSPSRALRSTSQNLLTVPRCKTVFSSRGFRIAAPTLWNALPDSVTSSTNVETFKRRLKTFYFAAAYTA